MDRVAQSYAILDRLRLDHGLYLASPSIDYSFVWLRDSCYEVLPYLNKSCDRYEKTYHRLLDLFKEYEWKLDIHQTKKPVEQWEFIHAKYDAHTAREIDAPWGHHQLDAIGAILFGIGQGIKAGKPVIRDYKDKDIVQKLVGYLACCEYWDNPDNGMWEEWREIHSSSVGACVAGLQAVRDLVFVPRELILKGYRTLAGMFPVESKDRPADLAQLSLIYPYKVAFCHDAKVIVDRVETLLLRKKGVIRYLGDSYYATNEYEGRHHPLMHYIGFEAEWTFGLPWLALCHLELGNMEKAAEYIAWTENVMLADGSLPELYFSGIATPNPNTPLGWSNAMYILAKEALNREIETQEKQKERMEV
ncbi:MAG: glycoside hydrolase family 15 protein [Bacillota bacterium]|nr:glycoside hydrolase family 15 protein [Bacillota bacterium]